MNILYTTPPSQPQCNTFENLHIISKNNLLYTDLDDEYDIINQNSYHFYNNGYILIQYS